MNIIVEKGEKYTQREALFVLGKMKEAVKAGILIHAELENNKTMKGKFFGNGKFGVPTNWNLRVYVGGNNKYTLDTRDGSILQALIDKDYSKNITASA